jgi:hypothetical protein
MTDIIRLSMALIPLLILPLITGLTLPWKANLQWSSRWWFGMILTGVLLMVLHALRVPAVAAMITILLLTGFYFYRTFRYLCWRKSHPASSFHDHCFQNWGLFSLTLLFLLATGYIHILSYPVAPADWDAISLWYKKTKLLYAWIPMGNTPAVDWCGNYMNYPHLGPVLEALVIRFTGALTENFGRLLMPTFYCAAVLALNYFRPARQRRLYALLLVVIAFLFFDLKSFTSGYQEGFLATLAGMSLIHFSRTFIKNNALSGAEASEGFGVDYFLAFFFAGSLCFVKSEGTLLALIICTSALLSYALTHSPKKWLGQIRSLRPYLILFAVLVVLWPLLLLLNHGNLTRLQDNYFTASTVSKWSENLNRWALIWPHYAQYLQARALVLIISASLSVPGLIWIPKSRPCLVFLWLTLGMHSAFVALPYFATGANPVWHLQTSFDRLMFQHFFLYPILLCVGTSFIADKIDWHLPSFKKWIEEL